MYIKHKILAFILFFVGFTITYFFKIDFNIISNNVVSIVSIAIAVYTLAVSILAGSPLSKNLKSLPDKSNTNLSQLGVIKKYIKSAVICSFLTLILSLITNLYFQYINYYTKVYFLISSVSFGLLIVNFLFFYIIFIFILNREVD